MAAASSATAPFFLLAFAITWGLQLPGVLAQRGWLPGDVRLYMPFAGLGILGPLIAALVLAWREGGRSGVRTLLLPLLHWRVHLGWYVMALLVPGALLASILLGLNAVGRTGPVVYFPVNGAIAFALVISLAEEVGWRGFALPRLQRRFGPFVASALLGVLWYLWHWPMFLGMGVPLDLVLVMLLYFMGASLLMTWIYNGTRGSLLLAVFAHLGAHLNNSHRALPDELAPLVAHAIVYAGLGLLVMRRALRRHAVPAR